MECFFKLTFSTYLNSFEKTNKKRLASHGWKPLRRLFCFELSFEFAVAYFKTKQIQIHTLQKIENNNNDLHPDIE